MTQRDKPNTFVTFAETKKKKKTKTRVGLYIIYYQTFIAVMRLIKKKKIRKETIYNKIQTTMM